MTEPKPSSPADPAPADGEPLAPEPTLPPGAKPLPLPGMAAIALYMLAVSAVIAFGVVGNHYPSLLLVISGFTACAGVGLLRQRRWGWALALAAAFLLMVYQFYIFARLHQASGGFMGALNLILFLYLVRPEVMERLK